MKYLIVSDNHGDREVLVQLFEKYKDQVDFIFHCGDSELPADDSLWKDDKVKVVTGNCDYDPIYQRFQLIDTGQDRIYLTHGHLDMIQFGAERLNLKADEAGATIVLFGHTHQIACERIANKLFVNPGSISQPRGPIQIQSYALIESSDDAYSVQYYNRNFQPVERLSFHFEK